MANLTNNTLAKCSPQIKAIPVIYSTVVLIEVLDSSTVDSDPWCISCWIHVGSKSLQKRRISAKRGQNKQIEKDGESSQQEVSYILCGRKHSITCPRIR